MEKNISRLKAEKNFFFQFAYQFIGIIVPLIISPYLTRILEDTGLGIYTYAYSIAYIFIIFANLGITNYGQRIIAENCEDKQKLRVSFWSLYVVHLFTSFLSVLLFYLWVIFFASENKTIYLIIGLYVASSVFDITWLFYGLENFKSIVIKNTIIKIVECILIFLFVKGKTDLWIYTLIASLSILLGQMVMLPQAFLFIKPIKINWGNIKIHIKPLLVFSFAVIAASMYTIFDKTLLGFLTTKENVAYYEYANKIITIPITFCLVISNVLFPKACRMASEGNVKGQKLYLKISLFVTAFIGFSSCFGLLAVSNQFVLIYYGKSFLKSGEVMLLMSVLPTLVGFSNVLRNQYLIPNGLDKYYLYCSIGNVLFNIVLSSLLIPVIGIYGAVVGTCAAELFGCIFQIVICRRFISPWEIIKTLIPFTIIGAVMFVAIKLVAIPLDQGIISLLIQVGVGAFVFVLLSVLYIFFFEKDIWGMTVGKIFKKKKI